MIRISNLIDDALGAVENVAARGGEMFDASVRLGVTGLARSGKTVFITSLVENLIRGERMPLFRPWADGRIAAAILRPQPDAAVARFDLESHLADLSAPIPHWPHSTRTVSELRVSIRYRPYGALRRLAGGTAALNLDIVDYPGEWLLDLGLLEVEYADWSRNALARMETGPRAALSEAYRARIAEIRPEDAAEEAVARELAALFTDYLRAARDSSAGLSLDPPGRFLLPGDLEGAPVLAFAPLPESARRASRASLRQMMETRYDDYRRLVARPFFRDHFSRLDRQIVLVDALTPMNAGAQAVAELNQSLGEALTAFRPGAASWLGRLLGRPRIDRILFAAAKADALHSGQHAALAARLGALVDDSIRRVAFSGADTRVMALASLRATRDAEVRRGERTLACVEGVLADTGAAVVVHPGRLPEKLDQPANVRIASFRPPRRDGAGPGLPHLRLDKALDYLIGDKFV